ncbi:MAG: hypothetical protein WCF88_01245 [Candidatus Acidiferrales bacterium]|jgi:hypothetical protein
MANVKFTLKSITREIDKAEKKLRALRSKVVKADLKRIDLNLRSLRRAQGIIGVVCRPTLHYGQTFRTKSK